jgi:hypothetical protein
VPEVYLSVNFYPFYYTIYVYADDLAKERYAAMADYDILLLQGFYWHPGFIDFSILGSWATFRLEVIVLGKSEVFQACPDSIRTIQLPFDVKFSKCRSRGIHIANTDFTGKYFISLMEGNYAIVFETWLNNSPEVLSRPDYQESIENFCAHQCGRMTIIPVDKPAEAKILRTDSDWVPPYEIEGYEPLNPPDPLVLDS